MLQSHVCTSASQRKAYPNNGILDAEEIACVKVLIFKRQHQGVDLNRDRAWAKTGKCWLGLALTVLMTTSPFAADRQTSAKGSQSISRASWAEKTLRTLSLEEKVGQLFQVRGFADYDSLEVPEYRIFRAQLQQYHIGSVVFGLHANRSGFVKPLPRQVAEITNRLQREAKIPLLIGADLERGLASRMNGVPIFPDQMALGAGGDPRQAYELGRVTAREARAVGINWAFAPVADVNTNPESPVINIRSFGDDPNMVGEFVAEFIRGAHSANLLVTAKHFPGQGDAPSDSHKTIPNIGVDLGHLQNIEFVPFRQAIQAGVDAVMVEHARVPALDLDPARVVTTSPKIVQDLLQGEMGFKGLVITDALEMPGLLDLYRGAENPSARAAVDAVKAGNDVIAVPKDLSAAFHAIVDAVRDGEIPESRIDKSVRKILSAKESIALHEKRFVDVDLAEKTVNNPSDLAFAQRTADRAITLVSDNHVVLPLRKSDRSKENEVVFAVFKYNIGTDSGQAFKSAVRERIPWAQVFFVDSNVAYDLRSTLLDAIKHAKKAVIVTFVSFNGVREELVYGKPTTSFGVMGSAADLLQEILKSSAPKVAVIAIGSPYVIENFPSIQTYLCTFSPSTTSEVSAVKGIFGEIQPEGKLPILLPAIADRGVGLHWPPDYVEQVAVH